MENGDFMMDFRPPALGRPQWPPFVGHLEVQSGVAIRNLHREGRLIQS